MDTAVVILLIVAARGALALVMHGVAAAQRAQHGAGCVEADEHRTDARLHQTRAETRAGSGRGAGRTGAP